MFSFVPAFMKVALMYGFKDFEEVESKLGHVLPERLKEFYLQYNGGEPKQQTISINKMCIRDSCKVFRYKFEHALIGLFDAGRLEHDFHDRMEFMGFIKNKCIAIFYKTNNFIKIYSSVFYIDCNYTNISQIVMSTGK